MNLRPHGKSSSVYRACRSQQAILMSLYVANLATEYEHTHETLRYPTTKPGGLLGEH